MLRRICLVILLVMSCAPTAWAKWKEEDEKYLNDHFKAVQDQIQALNTQLQSLSAQLAQLGQKQEQLGAFLVRQQRAIEQVNDMVTSMHLSAEDNFPNLKAAISQLRSETQAAFAKLSGQPMPAAGGVETPSAPRPAVAAKPIQDYITKVEGNTLTVGLGSRRGITQGQKLGVFKANDLSTQVALIEVSRVLDAENSLCTVINVNPGVQLEWGDVVRVVQ